MLELPAILDEAHTIAVIPPIQDGGRNDLVCFAGRSQLWIHVSRGQAAARAGCLARRSGSVIGARTGVLP